MSIWEFLDPSLMAKKREYKFLFNQYEHQRNILMQSHSSFVNILDTYRRYVAYNSGLIIIGSVIKMTDEQFDGLLKKAKNPPPDVDGNNVLPQSVQDEFKSKTGGSYVLHALYELNKITVDPDLSTPFDRFASNIISVQDMLYGLAMGGIGVLPDTERMPSALKIILSLPLQTAAFVSAIALDIITGPFQLLEEEREYEEAIDKVHKALADLYRSETLISQAERTLREGILKQKRQFNSIIKKLNKIKRATFDAKLSEDDPDAKFLAAQIDALDEYGVVMLVRTDWKNVQANDPNIIVTPNVKTTKRAK